MSQVLDTLNDAMADETVSPEKAPNADLRLVDAWELIGLPGRLDVAAYLTADQHATQYRVIVDALLDAQEHSLTGVGRDELMQRVRDRIASVAGEASAARLTAPEEFDLDARMRTLHNWGVVIRWQDKAKTEADFVRTRDRYQLTAAAADLHRWLRRKIDEDAVATSAAAFAPAVIADRLDEMLLALVDENYIRAAQSWAQVRTTISDPSQTVPFSSPGWRRARPRSWLRVGVAATRECRAIRVSADAKIPRLGGASTLRAGKPTRQRCCIRCLRRRTAWTRPTPPGPYTLSGPHWTPLGLAVAGRRGRHVGIALGTTDAQPIAQSVPRGSGLRPFE